MHPVAVAWIPVNSLLGFPTVSRVVFKICGVVAKGRNSREICPSAREICLASAIFMPHIFIHHFSSGSLPVRREIPDTGQSARPPIIRHPLPFRLLSSHDACSSSLRIQSMRSDALSVCVATVHCFFAELAGSVSAYVVLREQARSSNFRKSFAKFAGRNS